MRQAQGIYMISVVAETLEMHPQTLRKYERAGFVDPLRMGNPSCLFRRATLRVCVLSSIS